jgi:beta-phosphoglucomutase
MSAIKMVIFDLDGVLVDACEWHKEALNSALEEVCNYKISEEDHTTTFNGIPTRVKLSILTEMGVLSHSMHKKVFDVKQEKTIDIINKQAKIRQEKIDMILSLKKMGIYVCCFTNSIKKTANLMLEKTGVVNLFDDILTNEDVHKPKPNPEGYNFLVKKYKLKPEEVMIVEDSPKGLEAAYASGCKVIKVGGPDETTKQLFVNIQGNER